MITNKDNDTSERSGCQRERTAGEIPMNDLTSHTHGGNYRIARYQGGGVLEQSVVKYSLQLSMLNFLYSKELLSKNEYEKIRKRLRIKYTK